MLLTFVTMLSLQYYYVVIAIFEQVRDASQEMSRLFPRLARETAREKAREKQGVGTLLSSA